MFFKTRTTLLPKSVLSIANSANLLSKHDKQNFYRILGHRTLINLNKGQKKNVSLQFSWLRCSDFDKGFTGIPYYLGGRFFTKISSASSLFDSTLSPQSNDWELCMNSVWCCPLESGQLYINVEYFKPQQWFIDSRWWYFLWLNQCCRICANEGFISGEITRKEFELWPTHPQ